jgi:hypothetical protein
MGGQVARFTLILTKPDGTFSVKDAEIGDLDPDGKVSNWVSPNLDFNSGDGGIVFPNDPQYERIHYNATYDGPARTGESPGGRIVSFEISQDASTKLVFARYKDRAVLKQTTGCSDLTETISDSVYLCEYKP